MIQLFKSAALAFAGALSLSSAALAGSDASADLRIAYGDLNLSTPAGAAEFHQRADAAVSAWCEENVSYFTGRRGDPARLCRKEAAAMVQLYTPRDQRRALHVAAAAARQSTIEVAAR